MWSQLTVAALGVWLMIAPAALDHHGAAADADRVTGPLLAAVSLIAASSVTRPIRWLNLTVAVWLLAVSWTLDREAAAITSDTVVGVAVVLLTPLGRRDVRRFAGGWLATLGHDRCTASRIHDT